jgi:hypothetical protein
MFWHRFDLPGCQGAERKGQPGDVLIEARSSYLLYWQDKLKKVADRVITITRDGSQGMAGHINNLPRIVAACPPRQTASSSMAATI